MFAFRTMNFNARIFKPKQNIKNLQANVLIDKIRTTFVPHVV